MNVDNNLEEILKSQIFSIFNPFISNLEEILKDQNTLSQKEKGEVLKNLLDVLELVSPHSDTLTPEIKEKVNHIKHLLDSSNDIDELKEIHQVSPDNEDRTKN